MARISRLGGMSDAVQGVYPVAATVRTSSVHDVRDGVPSPADTEEQPWQEAGGDSTTPTSSESNSKPSGVINPFLPAPMTESLSSSDPTESGSADTTASESPNDK